MAQNPDPECPPNSGDIWVQLNTYGNANINIPFDSGYDNTDVDGPGPDTATGYINYLAGVMITEAGNSNHPEEGQLTIFDNELLKALAISARTVAFVNCGGVSVAGHSGIDDSNKQNYDPIKAASYADSQRYLDTATATQGFYMTYNGTVFDAQYRDISKSPTNGTTAPHQSVYDPAGIYHTNSLAQTGLPKINANHWAEGQNHGDILPQWNYLQILAHYYTDIHIVDANSIPLTPTYRWNPLTVNWGGGSFTPPPMIPNSTYNVVIALQNSGTAAWNNQFELSYQWVGPGGITNGATSVAVGLILEGGFTTTTLPVKAPSAPGSYTLQIDVVHENGGFFHNREAGRPWFTLDYEVCVGGACEQTFLPIVLRGDSSSSGPNCNWTIDNLLQDGGFSNSPPKWQEINVFVNPNPVDLNTLRAIPNPTSPYDGLWAAKLGGVNDIQIGPGIEAYELFEHLISQPVILPNDIEALSLEYSYYLTTFESSGGPIFDYFFVDLQLNALGSANSLLGNPLEYNDNHPFQDQWRFRGCDVGGIGCDGKIVIENVSQFAGDSVFVVFYSEVDPSQVSTLYIDAVKLSACTN